MSWIAINRPDKLIGFEINEYGIIRNIITKDPLYEYKDTHGYICVKITGSEYKVHRIVADHFISKIPHGYEVHHIDLNKSNPYYKNLIICTKEQHRRFHATTDAPVLSIPTKHGYTILNDDMVHEICKRLENKMSYPAIREELGLYNITDDCINKIAVGKNWTNISSQYNITKANRACMNSYSDNALIIGILMNRGYTAKEIGRMMGYDTSTNTSYQRLFKAATRYKQWLNEGKWGLIRRADADKLIEKYINK